MRKIISFNIDVDKLTVLDSYVQLPCTRSDLLNEIVGYMIDNPQTMSYFVTKRIDQTNLILSVNNE